MKFFTIITGLLVILTTVNGSNILFFAAFASKSHKNVLDPVAEELGKRGHNVVFFNPINDTRRVANVTEVYTKELQKILSNDDLNFFKEQNNIRSMFNFTAAIYQITKELINVSYSHPLIKDIIQNPRDLKKDVPKYDLVVVDALMNDYALPLAYLMKVPVVYISPTLLFSSLAWDLNIPFPLSYVNNGMSYFPLKPSFQDRAINAFFALFMATGMWRYSSDTDSLIKEYIPNVPLIRELLHNVSFVISNDHPSLGRSLPTMPYYIQLGGMHCKPAKKLPDELENFMQSAGKDGVIYFSLGSITKGASMPTEMKLKLAKTFAQLPQKILWKNEDVIEGMSKNVKFITWAPQQDILAHSNVKLFISHAGGLSTQEAGYHGCPILAFPLIADQFGNIGNAVNLGFGEYLDWKTFTPDELLNKIQLMLNDKSYRMNAQKVSTIFKDRPEHPAKTAAYWIEYVIRHNGAPHLKSAAEHLNFFQYFLLDVIGIVVTIMVLVLAISAFVIRRIYKFLCKWKQSEKDIKKKKH